jgi:hypothetical protein
MRPGSFGVKRPLFLGYHFPFPWRRVASTLLVTGTAQASEPSARNGTPASIMANCLWSNGCYKCYNYRTGSWEIQHCDGN